MDNVLISKTEKTIKNKQLSSVENKEFKSNSKIRNIVLTSGNIRNGTINLAPHIDMFPQSAIGGSSAESGCGKEVTIFAVGLSEPVKTDIAGDKKIFRSRFLGKFYKHHGLKAGDTVSLWRIGNDKYIIFPSN